MWQDFETEGFEGLIPYRARNEFSVTLEGFISLVEREYDLLNSADRNFTKHVSKSMFVWYSVQHAYARCIAIKLHSGENTYEEEVFLNYLRSENYPVPTPIEEYLRSIGDTKDKAGTVYKIVFPTWPNANGDFGLINAETHVDYENMISPRICSQRILNDLLYTQNPALPPNWNIPEKKMRASQPKTYWDGHPQ
jgi:hypothetical protein